MRVPGRYGDRCRTTTSLRPYDQNRHHPFSGPLRLRHHVLCPSDTLFRSSGPTLRACEGRRLPVHSVAASPLHTPLGDSRASQKLMSCDPVLTSQSKGVEHFHSQSYEPRGGARETYQGRHVHSEASSDCFSPTRAPKQRQVTGTGCGDFDWCGWEVPRGWG